MNKKYHNKILRKNYNYDRLYLQSERIDDGYYKSAIRTELDKIHLYDSIQRAKKHDNEKKLNDLNKSLENDQKYLPFKENYVKS